MSLADSSVVKRRPRAVVAALSVVGYVLVIGTLYFGLDFYPDIGLGTVNLLSHAIALVNTVAVCCLVAGWYHIRQGNVETHRRLMIASFTLIMVFLVMYLLKTGGGGRKDFVGPDLPYYLYLAMLGIHIVLSALSVPLVLYNITIGLSHSVDEIRQTAHARVGRITVAVWSVSLTLGVLAYVLLNHVYTFEFVPA